MTVSGCIRHGYQRSKFLRWRSTNTDPDWRLFYIWRRRWDMCGFMISWTGAGQYRFIMHLPRPAAPVLPIKHLYTVLPPTPFEFELDSSKWNCFTTSATIRRIAKMCRDSHSKGTVWLGVFFHGVFVKLRHGGLRCFRWWYTVWPFVPLRLCVVQTFCFMCDSFRLYTSWIPAF